MMKDTNQAKRRTVVWTAVILVVASSSGFLWSGVTGCRLKVKVLDTSRFVIPGAEVALTLADGKPFRTVLTNNAGVSVFTDLDSGSYSLKVVMEGFKDGVLDGVELACANETSVSLVLEVQEVASEVTVETPKSGGQRPELVSAEPTHRKLIIREEPPVVEAPVRELPLRARFYLDWFSSRTEGGSYSQLSNRLKMEMGSPPGAGWTFYLDMRDRRRIGSGGGSLLSVYDARLTYDSLASPIFLSFGEMNLYDTAGVGELLGGVVGWKPSPNWLVGGYGGFQSDGYDLSADPGYHKLGAFARYQGPKARTLSISLNQLSFGGQTERRFLYLNGLAPLHDRAILYGNMEFELGSNIASRDRLSRVFLNGRFNLTDKIDLLANVSTGRGLDFHRYLLERSQDGGLDAPGLERFYYSAQLGARLRIKFDRRFHLFVGQRMSEEKDSGIRNNTTQLGFYTSDIGGSGLSLNCGYNLNRGDRSESDSFSLSASRTFGRLSWNFRYSSSFNGIRISSQSGTVPTLIHMDNLHTFSNEAFFVLSRSLAISVQYEHSLGRTVEDLFFFRFIYRL